MKELIKILYGLRIKEYKEILFGFREKSFQAILEDNSKIFVKEIVHEVRRTERQAHMKHGLAISQTFREMGNPAPKVIKTLNGELIGNIQDRCFLVTEWVDGLTYQTGELTVKRASEMGSLLAKFHRQMGCVKEKVIVDYSFDQIASEYHSYHQAFNHEKSEYGAIARSFLAMQYKVTKEPFTRIEYKRIGQGFGSFWVEQIMYNPDDSVVALVDWTDLPLNHENQLNDLVIGAHLSGFNQDQLMAFIIGYNTTNPLSDGEIESVVWRICNESLYTQWYLNAWIHNKENMNNRWETSCKRWTLSSMEYYYQYDSLMDAFLD